MTRLARIVGLLAAVVAVLLLVIVAPVREIVTVEDAITGTQARKTVWFGCIDAGVEIRRRSELDTRLLQRGIPWTPDWRFRGSNQVSSVGLLWSCALGAGPPVEQLESTFSATATDSELRDFVRSMESASESEQSAIVDAANNTARMRTQGGRAGG